jgi:hypothetical protein
MRIVPAHISALYKDKLFHLWVEDEDTRTYLEEVWADPEIGLLVAGGSENLGAVVHAARNDDLPHVFGYRDRDFGRPNRASWNDPAIEIFVSDVHEVENLLLDGGAMAGCELNTTAKNAVDLENEMIALAGQLDWWMSCRHTIVSLRDAVTADFITHPSRADVRSRGEALAAITTQSWWTRVLPGIPGATAYARVEAELVQRQIEYSGMIASGEWRTRFSGKEIFREMRTHVWTKKQRPDPEGRLDFIKAIARTQRDYHTVPQEIVELRVALRARFGR